MNEEILQEIKSNPSSFVSNNDAYFNALEKEFPVIGSKIAWSRVPKMIEAVMKYKNDPTESRLFLEENLPSMTSDSQLVFIGDSAFDGALLLTASSLIRLWSALYELPQHHYIFPPDLSWCIAITLEGYMNFGYRPSG